MDNAASINRNKEDANDSLMQAAKVEDKGARKSVDGDGLRRDQSLIEVYPEIPVVDLLDYEEKTMVNADPVWLKKYDTCEEVTTNDEGEETIVKKESSDEDKINKGTRGGEVKREIDTLILKIDNTDNLDVYLVRSKNKAQKLKEKSAVLTVENLQKIESCKPPECPPVKIDAIQENPKKSGDSASTNVDSTQKKIAKKRIAKMRSTVKANPTRSLSDKAEKIAEALQQKKDGEPLCKKILCKVEPTNDNKQVELDKKSNVEKAPEKPAKTLSDSAIKSEDKKPESRFIWVSNISKSTRATDLKVHLTSYGKVMTAKIVTDGKLYYGYVVMANRDDVNNCIQNLDDTAFEGRKIRLSDRVPEKKPANKIQGAEPIQVKVEPITPEQPKPKSVPEIKPKVEIVKRKHRRSRSHDPLTLKVKATLRGSDRLSEERRKRKNEEILRRSRERRKHEIENEREEHRKWKIKEEEQKRIGLKLERERKKIERDRELIERDRLSILRLKKKFADSERRTLNRQKIEVGHNIHNISEDYKKRPGGFEDNRNNKFARIALEEPRRASPENREYWKSERRTSPSKRKKERFEMETYVMKKSRREDEARTAPPPPIISDNFDPSDRRRKEKKREWECRAYEKKEFPRRPVFKDRKTVEDYNFGDRRHYLQEKQYSRERYKPKYVKSSTGNWNKYSSVPYTSTTSSASWRNDVIKVVQRHSPTGFPVPLQFGSTSGMTHYYPQPEYTRPNEFYGRPPNRKY